MFTHLLVPLDGSRLAESVLPVVEAFSGRLQARVTLLHLLEPHAPAEIHHERHLTAREEAERYLADVAGWLGQRQVPADRLVEPADGDVAAAIARQAAALGADLVVLARHGRAGLRGLVYGRVAQQVLAHGTVPVLLVQPAEEGRAGAFRLRRLLVPLDGSGTAEIALPAVEAVAGAFAADAVLIQVVPTITTMPGEQAAAARLLPTAGAILLDAEAEQAGVYLDGIQTRLRGRGIVATPVVARGETVHELLAAGASHDVDLIVMATHGRSGIAAVWAGSVASRVLAQSTWPVLLIRLVSSRT